VRLGDTVTIAHDRSVRRVTVLALGYRRGPPAEARLLYAEPEPPRARRDLDREAWVPLLDDDTGDAGSGRLAKGG
jgi:hypothetical protein